ncbi:hypothetical protein [Paenibacillus sp. tmac-D7]|uniref:hypothetical protein n=1 Tax=Paenibacillus sp. tmac-D7 TaxID=2591462 RepID=UPI0006D29CDB|nr:hypothetical protein [Paenibacillus sp. tmac-D7]
MRAAKVVVFGLSGGGLIFLFSIMQDLSKYVFSLGALYVGYQFFTRNDSRAMRIGFVAAAVGFYFLFICFYAVFLFMNEPAQPA